MHKEAHIQKDPKQLVNITVNTQTHLPTQLVNIAVNTQTPTDTRTHAHTHMHVPTQ